MSDPSVVTPFQPSRVPGSFTCTRSPGRRGAAWFHLTGELDLSCVHRVAEELRAALSSSYLVAVDLRELDFIDCAGLGLLVSAAVEARRAKKNLVLIRGTGQVDKMLKVAGLLEWFEVVDVRGRAALRPSRDPDDLPAFCAKIVKEFAAGPHEIADAGATA